MDGTLSLLDLPSETLCAIVAFLDHPRDVVACICASAALACRSPLDAAASHYHGKSEAALAAGLPLRVVRALFDRWGMTAEYRHLPLAARGGRIDVVRWVCAIIKPSTLSHLWVDMTTAGPMFNPEYALAPDAFYRQGGRVEGQPRDKQPHTRTAGLRCFRGLLGSTEDDRPTGPIGSTRDHGPRGPIGRRGPMGDYGQTDNANDDGMDNPSNAAGKGTTPGRSQGSVAPAGGYRALPSRFGEGFFGASPAARRGGSPQGPPDSAARTLHLKGDTALMPYLTQAIYEAACAGHIDVLRYLTTACHLAKMPCALDVRIVVEAARRGTLATVAYAHDRWPHRLMDYYDDDGGDSAVCCCPVDIAEAAGEHRHVLDWMRAVGCRAFVCTNEQLARAIGAGNDRLVDAIADALSEEARAKGKSADDVLKDAGLACTDAIFKAARSGRVRSLAIAHTRGLARLTPSVLGAAANAGQLDVLRWAAGESVPGVEACLVPTARLPWDDPVVAWSAAERADFGSTAVLGWLAAQPAARCHFNVMMARALLARGRLGAVLWMHDAGIVSLSDWESLEIAIKGGLTCLADVVERGAPCSPRVMATALMHSPGSSAIALLCERFGYDDLYEALRTHVRAVDNDAIRWVRDNVPNADVDPIIEAGKAHASAMPREQSHVSRRATTRRQHQTGLGWPGQLGKYKRTG
ncbi:Sam maturase domain-containing protein [Pandoravirus kuranda]|uniref:Sam maturase domain-containing protein n=1 Tax=Pandoravirus kuranda TaxID=3019033 RepID=A0AA95EDJ9_9VIRU|nr:Sam maturase domain-containing protein [Pandoravirus kuranda]